jgi:peptide/nickel transport system permease protein
VSVSSAVRPRPRTARAPWAADRTRQYAALVARNPILFIGAVIVGLTLVAAAFGPQLAPYDPEATNAGARLRPPGASYVFGTDHLARDILSRLLYGARVSLLVGVLSTAASAVAGVAAGAVAGYSGGWFDEVVMRLMDVIMGFPAIVLAITLVALVGPGLVNLVFIIGLIRLPHFARLMRGSILSLKQREFVVAARAIGQRDMRILFGHVVPNAITPIIVLTSLSIATAIVTESALSFLGLGVRPPEASWGTMLKDGQQYMLGAPWVATFPGLAITFTVLGYNLVGDGLRDIFDPRTLRRTPQRAE